jgi:putative addiction module killer protein
VFDIIRSKTFDQWLKRLADTRAKVRIAVRIDKLAAGHFGDTRPVGSGISELRLHCGPGYRIYFMRRGHRVIVLLCGGDKSSQSRDIAQAISIAAAWKEDS